MTLTPTRTTAALLAALTVLSVVGGGFAVGGAAAVPDARITLTEVGVSPGAPTVDERATLNVTVSNSGGSDAAANLTTVRVRDADGDVLDSASGVGALSAGDSLDATLWTTFREPGEKRLTVEVVANQSTSGEFVTVSRDVVFEVRPTEVALDLRTRALDPEDLRSDDESESATGDLGIGGIQGVFGGGGGLDTGDGGQGEASPPAVDSPVEVTVVNTGTTAADRISLRAVGAAVDGDGAETVDVGPFVVEGVAPGEERRVIVDLGPLDRRSDVTVTAAFRADTDRRNDRGADRSAESTVTYPVREATPTVTDATVRETADGVVVDANLGNAGSGEMTGAVVSVGDAPGVAPTPAGGEYFVGTLGASDFVGFDVTTAANVTVAEEIPIRVTYTERGVRYTETFSVAAPEPATDDRDGGGTLGRLGAGGLGTVGTVASGLALVGLAGAVGVAVRTGRLGGPTGRRRDGSAP
ncbi:CARDB domain-containing protein [Halorubrum ezzemoulense]|uniref:CARDB domain-containing protein n=1 Tax=Halorubrum ezzemoulense TaxID=337243 RepID=A0ABT4Z1D4_HALEZ|nr:CARDB domain-containing protein [Halorubrum ezzemoulense]MDB2243725.1 CARDB domain-containing protein [Halorubrum ezzemoulense]MDB2251791.1 CARDB domain-containing protein [Halorubrum ezzemoulense]MDB2277461.1 CARDB domain-containing protein [Halorubrum ezzemoulense]MDB2280810.1 CARDB domain-containing protein [Halorubrum ezzemoulense]MDB2284171.1 CARDB domain-containing protein [Halorubrum ezzemoulense]